MRCLSNGVADRLDERLKTSTDDVVRLAPTGERFHYGESIEVCERIAEHLAAGHKHFLLDGSDLVDVTLPAIALLVEQIREVNAADGSFAVAHLTGRPLAVFEIYHLENLFQRID